MINMDLAQLNPISTRTISGITDCHFISDGPAGKLEYVLSVPETDNRLQAIAVVCHPHPLFDGTLNNKVTYTIARSLNKIGVPALRFNFRGVEKSDGAFDNGNGELADLMAAIEKIQSIFPDKDLWLAGFSFGAYIALCASKQVFASKLITVAPPVKSFDFNLIPLPECDWLLIQGTGDEVVSAKDVLYWARSLKNPPQIVEMEGASHFFHRRLLEVRDIIIQHIAPNILP